MAELYAKNKNYKLKIFPAEWKKYGKSAGPIRNSQMIDYIKNFEKKAVVAFIGPNSRGTKDTVKKAEKANIQVSKVYYENNEIYINKN